MTEGVPGLSVETTELDAGVRVAVTGEVDLATASQFARALSEVLKRTHQIEVDLADVTFMDSQGLRALIDARTAAKDGSVQVVAASPVVRKILSATGLDVVFALPAPPPED